LKRKFENKRTAFIIIFLLLIFLSGLSYRLLFVNAVNFDNLHNGTAFGHDEYYYNKMAQNIVNYGVYGYMTDAEPNAYVTPGYPVFLASIYHVFGDDAVDVAKTVQAYLSAFSIILVFIIGKKLSGNAVGLIAALFVSFYPPLIFYSRFLLTETLYIFLFLVYYFALITAFKKEKKKYHFFAGLAFAATILVRPLIFFLLPLPYIYEFFASEKDKKGLLLKFTVFVFGFCLVMLPWWVRNLVTLNQFVLLCTQSNPFYYGIIENYSSLPQSENEMADGLRLIWRHLIERPVETIKWYIIGKINIIFGKQDYWEYPGYVYLKSVSLLHYFILVTGTIGVLLSIYKKEIRLLSIYIVLTIGFQLLFIPVGRYAVPIMPLFSICGAYVLCYLYRNVKGAPLKS